MYSCMAQFLFLNSFLNPVYLFVYLYVYVLSVARIADWFAHRRGTDFSFLISVISFPARLTLLPQGWRR